METAISIMLLAQSDATGGWLSAVANLGIAICLVLYLVVYGNPQERRESNATMLAALAQQRVDHEKWQMSREESWAKIVGIMSDARFEIIKELRDAMRTGTERIGDVDTKLGEVDGHLESVDTRIASVIAKIDAAIEAIKSNRPGGKTGHT